MSVTKRGKFFYLAIRPFGKLVYVKTEAKTKGEAKELESQLRIAYRSGDFRALTPEAREVCVRLFRNQGLETPSGLSGYEPTRELTLMEAVRIFLQYPPIKESPTRKRYAYALTNLVEGLGADMLLKQIWLPELRLYRIKRLQQPAVKQSSVSSKKKSDTSGKKNSASKRTITPGTVNKEINVLSKLFRIMIEMRLLDTNPCRLLEPLKPGHREAYLSYADVQRIVDLAPDWYKPILWTAYYSGMRRGELLGLTRKSVNLTIRIIRLGETETKEGRVKRVPIHRDLVPILEQCMKVSAIGTDRLFLMQDENGVRPLSPHSLKNLWRRRILQLGIEPKPTFHDLRHTWKTNARRSGMDPEIRESVLGHWYKAKSVNDRYGRISDEELLAAIDAMTFDHGQTELWVNTGRKM